MRTISICDVSLRDVGKGLPNLGFKEKLEIAKRLGELSVDVIELDGKTESKSDEILIKTLCQCLNKSVVCVSCDLTEDSIKKNVSLISSAKKKRLSLSFPVSPVDMEYSAGKKPKAVLDGIDSLVKTAAETGAEVEVSFSDATRAEREFLKEAALKAINGGAKVITLADKEGAMLPEEFSAFISDVKKSVDFTGVKLNAEFCDSLKMGAACYVSAILCGIDGIKTSTVSGYGLPVLGDMVKIFLTVGRRAGFSCRLNVTGINSVMGRIAVLFARKNGEETLSDVVKEDADLLDGDMTQKRLSAYIKKRGYDLSADDSVKVYSEFKRLAEKKSVNSKELDLIIATTALQVPDTYKLVSFSVNSSNVLAATASVVLCKNGENLSGLSFGNGSVDAAFLALEKVIGRHFELDDFDVSAVTEGKEAMGETLIKLRSDGKVYSGRGVSTDIVGASIRAYLNAVNKIIYEENER